MPLELLQDSDSILVTIAPHWSSSYPEYLSQNQTPEEQQSVVWSRLHSHRTNVAKRLSKERERYLAVRRELNPRTTQAESSHEPLSRDIVLQEIEPKVRFLILRGLYTYKGSASKPPLNLVLYIKP